MFARQLNQARIELSIVPRGPVLIRSGRTGADPTRPDLEAVRTTIDGRKSVYFPGSSLKGVMRAHAERLLLSEGVAITPTFDTKARQAFRQSDPAVDAHVGTCPLGRTFGTLHLKGRVGVSDFTPGGFDAPGSSEREEQLDLANAVEERNGVGIDRLLGSAKGGALFNQEAVVQGRFDGQVVFRNFQLYQLALVLLAVRDLDDGFVQIGSGTSRGNGWVGASIRRIVIETRHGQSPPGLLVGAAGLDQKYTSQYGLFGDDQISVPDGLVPVRRLLWDQLTIPAESVDAFAETLIDGVWDPFLTAASQRKGLKA